MISAFLISHFLIFRKSEFFVRQKPKINYLIPHVICIFAFAFCPAYFPKAESAYLLFNRTVLINLAGLFFLICTYYTLFFAFLYGKDAFNKYLRSSTFALLSSIVLCIFLIKVQEASWELLRCGIAKIIFLMLRVSGLRAFFYFSYPDIIVGTDLFKVAIFHSCSGIEGIYTFLVALIATLILNWEKINKERAVIVAGGGILIMYITNIVRVYLLVLIGHFYNKKMAIKFFHSYGGLALYVIIVILLLSSSYEWMIGPKIEKNSRPLRNHSSRFKLS